VTTETALRPFRIGDILVDPPLLLAPMAGHTNVAFRTLVRELGSCGLVCSELISSHVLTTNPQSRKTRDLFDWSDREWPFAVQLFGADPAEMAHAARVVESAGAPIVDINMGCWVPKVAKKGCGAALLDNLPLATEVVQAVVEAVQVPVTVKVRAGFVPGQPTAVDFACGAAKAGAKLVTVHGRYAKQGFKGESDHTIAARVKEAVGDRMLVVANGDILDPHSAREIVEQTNCDGLMVGREALRRPWIFAQLAHTLCGHPPPNERHRPLSIARRQVELTEKWVKKPEKIVVRELRGQLLPYRLGAPTHYRNEKRAPLENELRQLLVKVQTFEDLENFFCHAETRLQK